jgi:acyl dehydratase
MLGPAFPFRIAGMIHVANTLEEQGAVLAGQPLRLATTVRVDRHPSGAVHCVLETEASQQGRPVFSCSSDYLAVRGARGGAAAKPAPEPALPLAVGTWRPGPAAGRQYAAVAGDWNPIHLYRWSARLFGLPAPIIHGMHTMGKACALLEGVLGRRIVMLSGRFRSPIALGDEVALAADLAAGAYAVSGHGRRAVEGSFRAAGG